MSRSKEVLCSGATSLSRLMDINKPSGTSQIGAINSACLELVPFLNLAAGGHIFSARIGDLDLQYQYESIIFGGDCEFNTACFGIGSASFACCGCTTCREAWMRIGRLLQPDGFFRTLQSDQRGHEIIAQAILNNDSLVGVGDNGQRYLKVCQGTLRGRLKEVRDSKDVAGQLSLKIICEKMKDR